MIWFTDRDPDEAANHLCDKHLRPAIQFAKKAVTEARENRTQHADPYLRFRKSARVEDIMFLLNASASVGQIIDAPITRTPFPDDIEKVRDRYRTEISPKSKWTKRWPPDWLVE
jgi:hypothetical protein